MKKDAKKSNSIKVNKQALTSEEKKQIAKAKREANPQFSHLLSAARKKEIAEFKKDAKANLIEAKRRSSLFEVDSFNKYENAVALKEAKKLINLICKKDILLEASIIAVSTRKGSHSPHYFAQLIQKLVKISNKHKCSHIEALNIVIKLKAKK